MLLYSPELFVCLRKQYQYIKNATSNTPADPPITIPTISPVDNVVEEEVGSIVVVEVVFVIVVVFIIEFTQLVSLLQNRDIDWVFGL